jgi:uncharacterized protein (TIGR02597 family)
MNIPQKTLSLLAIASLSTFSNLSAVETAPVGYITISCLGGSDTVTSVPLAETTAAASTVLSVDSSTSQITINLNTMVANDYQDSHYVRFGEGSSLEGAKMTVSANSVDTLTLDVQSGYDLGNVSVGDAIDIIPHITLSGLFASVSSIPDSTEVFFFDNATNGINKSSSGGYIYFAPDWYDANTFAVVNGAVLFPDDALIVRVPGDSSNDFDLINSGAVPTVGHSFSVVTAGSGANDNFIAPQVPGEVELATLFSSAADNDEILVFDNTVRAQNKSSSGGYIFFAPNWYDAGTFAVVDTLKVNPWEMAVYRRASQGGPSAAVFSGRASYLDNL